MPFKGASQFTAPNELLNQTDVQAPATTASDLKAQFSVTESATTTPTTTATPTPTTTPATATPSTTSTVTTTTTVEPEPASTTEAGHIDLFDLLETPFKVICDVGLFLMGPDRAKIYAARCEAEAPLASGESLDEALAAPKPISIMDANPKTGHIELFELMEIPFRVVCDLELSITGSSEAYYTLQYDIPDGKLFYPEPFIASPTYHHTDLSFLHIFQYWYWLWFAFIFLICFFFLTFITVVRWNAVHVRPRRETRGVSRSKCGDLITACVPVSWAMSIIIHESTDAADINDGFGTAEMIVGVRAYQWGWEYYYPKSIDLNYDVKSSYSAFVGNSLAYNSSSSSNDDNNFLWEMYQNKSEDRVITPAHLLLVPSDSADTINFLNFKNIGINSLNESSAFAKIRNFTKVYNTHLVHTPSSFVSKYNKLNSLYGSEDAVLGASPFSITKQQNLLSISSIGNDLSGTLLDSGSLTQFLSSAIGIGQGARAQSATAEVTPSSLPKLSLTRPPLDFTRFAPLLAGSSTQLTANQARLGAYPALLGHVNSDSDKPALHHPALHTAFTGLLNGVWTGSELQFSQGGLESATSHVSAHAGQTYTNATVAPRTLNINGTNARILAGDQSLRSLPPMAPSSSSLNVSLGENVTVSNLSLAERVNRATTPFSNATAHAAGYADYPLVSKLAGARSFSATPHPASQSAHAANSGSLEYDTGRLGTQTAAYLKTGFLAYSTQVGKSPVGDVFVGSREKTPKSINAAYWDSLWATTNSSHRVLNSLRAGLEKGDFYLPTFSNYADYDFRNAQAIDMLEELFWEHSYSGYGFYDYMALRNGSASLSAHLGRSTALGVQFYDLTLGLGLPPRVTKDLSLSGSGYGNSIQMENYTSSPSTVATRSYFLFPIHLELTESGDAFATSKLLPSASSKLSAVSLFASTSTFGSRSYASVFDSFRSDFSCFDWYLAATYPSTPAVGADGTALGSSLRVTNPVTLRASVRNSIVNYSAFQKVFKARLDEGRAHVRATSFADLSMTQPFISDTKVPYTRILGKDRTSFFETPLHSASPHASWNQASALTSALNVPMYDFPFLLARVSDSARFTWIDWFSKWGQTEVQPASVSRYSLLGVPYSRKPFDFNSATGDKFQETELYFTRVARSRRNYLTNWSYSPFMYNRTYVWNAIAGFDTMLLSSHSLLSSAKAMCSDSTQYWLTPASASNTSEVLSFSSSGNDVYAKSTWRPRASIQSYYYNVSKLIDILSRREYLYRLYLEKSYRVGRLPQTLCATPNSPLLQELKSSFLFSDPATFSSEFSRDLLYGAAPYFKLIYLKSLTDSARSALGLLPLNTDALTNYSLFYLSPTSPAELGRNSDLYKSQYRPLKKGVSSMLRLQATGAVAMPAEVRLQVLASSRDIIHSWAVPSANLKIDCIPGYTSHRTLKFLGTGVYFGQCQEICGRAHHLMTIIVHVVKIDSFLLWSETYIFSDGESNSYSLRNHSFAETDESVSETPDITERGSEGMMLCIGKKGSWLYYLTSRISAVYNAYENVIDFSSGFCLGCALWYLLWGEW